MGHDVGVGLRAALGVEGAGDIAELSEDVEAVEHDEELAFEEGTGEAGVPNKVVGVQLWVGIACSAVEAEIGREVKLPRQLQDGREGGAAGEGTEVLEIYAVSSVTFPHGLTAKLEVMLADVGLEGGG